MNSHVLFQRLPGHFFIYTQIQDSKSKIVLQDGYLLP